MFVYPVFIQWTVFISAYNGQVLLQVGYFYNVHPRTASQLKI